MLYIMLDAEYNKRRVKSKRKFHADHITYIYRIVPLFGFWKKIASKTLSEYFHTRSWKSGIDTKESRYPVNGTGVGGKNTLINLHTSTPETCTQLLRNIGNFFFLILETEFLSRYLWRKRCITGLVTVPMVETKVTLLFYNVQLYV